MATVFATGVTIDKATLTLSVGDTWKLVHTVQPDTTTDKSVTWTSDHTNVATVNENGLVTAKWGGAATITARVNTNHEVKATCAVTVKNYNLITDRGFLGTEGISIIKKGTSVVPGNRQPIVLKGVNLGIWLSRSFWALPIVPLSERDVIDHPLYSTVNNITIKNILADRFPTRYKELNKCYYDHYITASDLDTIARTGANVVRVPFEWSFFIEAEPYPYVDENGMKYTDSEGNPMQTSSGGIIQEYRPKYSAQGQIQYIDGKTDYTYLDWIVAECRKRGLYVIFDLHVAPGGLNNAGYRLRADFFAGCAQWEGCEGKTYGEACYECKIRRRNQEVALDLWARIAARFKGNPGVAGYDIINEPGAAGDKAVAFYEKAYTMLRRHDPDHIIIMETNPNKGIELLPNPGSKGWTNVVYSTHDYFWNNNGPLMSDKEDPGYEVIKTRLNQKIAQMVSKRNEYQVPVYVGEFNGLANIAYQQNAWLHSMNMYENYNMSYTAWTYKAGWDPYMGIVYYGRKGIVAANKADITTAGFEDIKAVFSGQSDEIMNFNPTYHDILLNQFGGRLVTAIALSRTSVTIKAGRALTLIPTVLPNTAINKKVEWHSSDSTIATINQNGTIAAKKPGMTTVTAQSLDREAVKATCTVTVEPVEA